jgi:hypothetical protein
MTTQEIRHYIVTQLYYEFYTFDGWVMSRWVRPDNINLVKEIKDLPIEIEDKKFRLKRRI